MPRVAIIGSGLIGRSWAMVFARAGWDVALWDPVDGVAETALAHIADGLRELAAHGLVDDPAGAAARVRAVAGIGEAVAGATYVQECAPEVLDTKLAVFTE